MGRRMCHRKYVFFSCFISALLILYPFWGLGEWGNFVFVRILAQLRLWYLDALHIRTCSYYYVVFSIYSLNARLKEREVQLPQKKIAWTVQEIRSREYIRLLFLILHFPNAQLHIYFPTKIKLFTSFFLLCRCDFWKKNLVITIMSVAIVTIQICLFLLLKHSPPSFILFGKPFPTLSETKKFTFNLPFEFLLPYIIWHAQFPSLPHKYC